MDFSSPWTCRGLRHWMSPFSAISLTRGYIPPQHTHTSDSTSAGNCHVIQISDTRRRAERKKETKKESAVPDHWPWRLQRPSGLSDPMTRPRGALAGGISPLSQRCTRWAGHHLPCRGACAQLLAAGQVDGPLPGGSEDHPLFQNARPTCNLQRRRKHVAKAFHRPSLLARRQAGLLDAPAAAALPNPRVQSEATNVHCMACLCLYALIDIKWNRKQTRHQRGP